MERRPERDAVRGRERRELQVHDIAQVFGVLEFTGFGEGFEGQ